MFFDFLQENGHNHYGYDYGHDKKSKNKAKPRYEYFTKTDDDEAKPKNDLEYTSRETMFEEKPDDPSEKKDPDSEKNI